MKRRAKGKSMAQMENAIVRSENKGLYQQLMSLVSAEKMNISPHQLQTLAKSLKSKAAHSIDVGYIRTVLFPELYSYDIPQPLSNISYSRFTDKQEATITTGTDGSNGSGIMLWYPKVNYGPSLFFYPCAATQLDSVLPIALKTTGTQSSCLDESKWKVGFIQQYDQYFQQTCLVAASISLQYVGQLQVESGYFVGGQVFSQGINAINVDDVENAQFRVLAKPGEGIRLLYLPKDATDYTYYPCKAGVSHNTGNAGANEDQFYLAGNTSYPTVGTWTSPSYTPSMPVTYMNNTPCLAIYWKGLPASQNILRVDSTRKFNGVPKQAIRDIVDVSRPRRQYDAKKTTDVVSQLILSVPQLGGHTIKQMDHVSDEIQAYLPNIGHLYSSGILKEGMTLQGLSQGLSLQQSGLSGPATNIGQIWE